MTEQHPAIVPNSHHDDLFKTSDIELGSPNVVSDHDDCSVDISPLKGLYLEIPSSAVQTQIDALKQDLELLKIDIDQLHKRNIFKDKGKDFEGSWVRVVVLMTVSYLTVFGYLSVRGVETAALDAVVPAIGFNISTWSLPYVKAVWIKMHTNIWRKSVYELASDKVQSGELSPKSVSKVLGGLQSNPPMKYYQTGFIYSA